MGKTNRERKKYEKLALYLNADVSNRNAVRKQYKELMQLFEEYSLLGDIISFHLRRERLVDLREEVSVLEKDLRDKIGKIFEK